MTAEPLYSAPLKAASSGGQPAAPDRSDLAWAFVTASVKALVLAAGWASAISVSHGCSPSRFPDLLLSSPMPALLLLVAVIELEAFLHHAPRHKAKVRGWKTAMFYVASWTGFTLGYGCRFAHLVCGAIGLFGMCEGAFEWLSAPAVHVGLLATVTMLDAFELSREGPEWCRDLLHLAKNDFRRLRRRFSRNGREA